MQSIPLLESRHLTKRFPRRHGIFSRPTGELTAVDDVSLTIAPHEVLGLVGESGCGKSTLGRLMLGLQEPSSGEVIFHGIPLNEMTTEQHADFRRTTQIVFQDPQSSLNPRLSAGSMLREAVLARNRLDRKAADTEVLRLLECVGLDQAAAKRYPHEFSSGQRQRLCIARALAVSPSFIVCDEPVSALDVSIQAQILNLLLELQRQFGLSYLFISHDLSVVRHISDRIAVMYRGRIVEIGPTESVHGRFYHPYTELLLASIPVADPRLVRLTEPITEKSEQDVSTTGCPFRPRCARAQEICATQPPPEVPVGRQHLVRCHLYSDAGESASVPSYRSPS